MKPILFGTKLGGVEVSVPTYGVMVMLGFAVGIFLVARRGKRQGLAAEPLLDLSWWLLVAGLLGSRVVYVAQNAGDFLGLCRGSGEPRSTYAALHACAAPLRLWDGGLVFYGGALAAAAVAYFFARRRGWAFPMLADLFAPALVAGHAIGRLGCFAAGCCYGKICPSDGVTCVSFPPGSVAHARLGELAPHLVHPSAATPPLYATQLAESVALLLLLACLLFWRRRQRFTGQLFLVYVIGYAALRFAVELYRGDAVRRFVFEWSNAPLARALGLPEAEPLLLSSAQTVSLLLLAAAVATLEVGSRRAGGLWRARSTEG